VINFTARFEAKIGSLLWFLGVMKRLRGTKLAVKEKYLEEWLRMKERIV
jgi:hypothetical protein